MLALQSVVIDYRDLGFVWLGGLIDNASGTLSDVYFNSIKAALPTGDFSIARLNFTAKASSTSPISLSASGDPFANDQVRADRRQLPQRQRAEWARCPSRRRWP